MGQNSKIEWTHHTFNPWRGCTKVSAGCANCYADKMSGRNPKVLGIWGKDGTRVVAAEAYWRQALAWNAAAKAAGERHRVFCASLADIGEGNDTMPPESWGAVDFARRRLEGAINETPWLHWLLLTKRPENLPNLYAHEVLGKCWIGTSVENQATADERIPHLLKCPAAIRFLSMEPLLGPVDLDTNKMLTFPEPCYRAFLEHHKNSTYETRDSAYSAEVIDRCPLYFDGCNCVGVSWVIVGGESGPHARPMHPDWARSLRDQCAAAGVPFFFKQWGEWFPSHSPNDPPTHFVCERGHYDLDNSDRLSKHSDGDQCIADTIGILRLGKRAAGHLLDGQEHHAFPAIPQEARP